MSENTQNQPPVRRSSLIPQAQDYLDHHLNVLLIGKHGVGKTQVVRESAAQKGWKVKYYSCATLDPYTDLVGVPVPEGEGKTASLNMVRPHDVDDADMIFFDEANRADDKVLNAILEIVQFRSINGEPLPKLKACWAAINPPTEEYHVQELDPALIDRFDVFVELTPNPSVSYLSTVMPKPVAQALCQWWNDHNQSQRAEEDYVSPRRLEKIGMTVTALNNPNIVPKLLPPGGKYDSSKLINMLKIALAPESKDKGEFNKAAMGPSDQITFKGDWVCKNIDFVVEALTDEHCTDETKQRVVKCLSDRISAERWVEAMVKIYPHIEGMWVETEVNSMPDEKARSIRWLVAETDSDLKKCLWN